MNKRIIALLMAGAMVGSMTGCAPKKRRYRRRRLHRGRKLQEVRQGKPVLLRRRV